MINNNIILNTDSYKASHFLQYPEKTQNVFSYIEARDRS
jgi:nicotinamide phosphoribosyltransferase